MGLEGGGGAHWSASRAGLLAPVGAGALGQPGQCQLSDLPQGGSKAVWGPLGLGQGSRPELASAGRGVGHMIWGGQGDTRLAVQ